MAHVPTHCGRTRPGQQLDLESRLTHTAESGSGPESSKNGFADPCHPPLRFSYLLGAPDLLAHREGNWEQALKLEL